MEEAGGWVSDIDGKKLDFHAGKTLRHNRGILATNGRIHSRVLEIIAGIVEDGRFLSPRGNRQFNRCFLTEMNGSFSSSNQLRD